jgi:hypothetical protein
VQIKTNVRSINTAQIFGLFDERKIEAFGGVWLARYALASYYYSAEVGSLERKFNFKFKFCCSNKISII